MLLESESGLDQRLGLWKVGRDRRGIGLVQDPCVILGRNFFFLFPIFCLIGCRPKLKNLPPERGVCVCVCVCGIFFPDPRNEGREWAELTMLFALQDDRTKSQQEAGDEAEDPDCKERRYKKKSKENNRFVRRGVTENYSMGGGGIEMWMFRRPTI